MVDLVPGCTALFGIIGFLLGCFNLIGSDKDAAGPIIFGCIGAIIGAIIGVIISFIANGVLGVADWFISIQNLVLQAVILGIIIGVVFFIIGVIDCEERFMVFIVIFPIFGGVIGAVVNGVGWIVGLNNLFLQGLVVGMSIVVLGSLLGFILLLFEVILDEDKFFSDIIVFSIIVAVLSAILGYSQWSLSFASLQDFASGVFICICLVLLSYFVYKIVDRKRTIRLFFHALNGKVDMLLIKNPDLRNHTDILTAKKIIQMVKADISLTSNHSFSMNVENIKTAEQLVETLRHQNNKFTEIKLGIGNLRQEKYAGFFKDDFDLLNPYQKDIANISLLEEGYKNLQTKITSFQDDMHTLEKNFFFLNNLLEEELGSDVVATSIKQQIREVKTITANPENIAEAISLVEKQRSEITGLVGDYIKKKQEWLRFCSTLDEYREKLRCDLDSSTVRLKDHLQRFQTMEFTDENLGILRSDLPGITTQYEEYLLKKDALIQYRKKLSEYTFDKFIMESCNDVLQELEEKCTDSRHLDAIPLLFLTLEEKIKFARNKRIHDELLMDLHAGFYYDDIIEKIDVAYNNVQLDDATKSDFKSEIQSRNNLWNERELRSNCIKNIIHRFEETIQNEVLLNNFRESYFFNIEMLLSAVRIEKDKGHLDTIDTKLHDIEKSIDSFVDLKEKLNDLMNNYPEYVEKFQVNKKWMQMKKCPIWNDFHDQITEMNELLTTGKEMLNTYESTKYNIQRFHALKIQDVNVKKLFDFYEKYNEDAKKSFDKELLEEINYKVFNHRKQIEKIPMKGCGYYYNPLDRGYGTRH